MPIEPPPGVWTFPHPGRAGPEEVVAVGGDLEPRTILAAYRQGLFPMPLPDGRLAWWSPVQRGVIPLEGLRVSRSLRRSCRRYTVTVDRSFLEVVEGCADRRRPHAWITGEIVAAYLELHRLGWAHSLETRDDAGRLVGGLYGMALGGLFAGESMFHRAPDASKVALVALAHLLREGDASLLDVQWATPHLVSLGAVEIPRSEYLQRLGLALAQPLPAGFR
ncbi:MAG: leucyl/phenylalanyl-tRNA--protein transferase [Acidimicrobiia bacterium]